MTDIESRLVDGMRGQGIRLPNGDWLRLDDENLTLIAERLLSLPGIAIVDGDEVASLKDLAEDIRADIKQAKAEGDNELASYFRGELQGILRAHDLLAAAKATEAK